MLFFFKLPVNPTDVLITTRQGSMSAGERIEFTCVSKGSRPAARISWWKDGKDLKRYATDEINGDVTTSKLFLSPTSEDHNKILTCRAENPVNADSALEDQLVLNVYCKLIFFIFRHGKIWNNKLTKCRTKLRKKSLECFEMRHISLITRKK